MMSLRMNQMLNPGIHGRVIYSHTDSTTMNRSFKLDKRGYFIPSTRLVLN